MAVSRLYYIGMLMCKFSFKKNVYCNWYNTGDIYHMISSEGFKFKTVEF